MYSAGIIIETSILVFFQIKGEENWDTSNGYNKTPFHFARLQSCKCCSQHVVCFGLLLMTGNHINKDTRKCRHLVRVWNGDITNTLYTTCIMLSVVVSLFRYTPGDREEFSCGQLFLVDLLNCQSVGQFSVVTQCYGKRTDIH